MTGISLAAIDCKVAALAAFCAAIPLSVALALPASADPVSAPQPLAPGCVDYNGDGKCDAYYDDDPSVPDASPPECVPGPGSPWGCPDD